MNVCCVASRSRGVSLVGSRTAAWAAVAEDATSRAEGGALIIGTAVAAVAVHYER